MQSIDVIKNINKNKNDISNINYELSKTENTSYTTINGIKEFSCKDGYVDNVVIEGETLVNLTAYDKGVRALTETTGNIWTTGTQYGSYSESNGVITFNTGSEKWTDFGSIVPVSEGSKIRFIVNMIENTEEGVNCIAMFFNSMPKTDASGVNTDKIVSLVKKGTTTALGLRDNQFEVPQGATYAIFALSFTSANATYKFSDFMLLVSNEDKPISYFEGLKSVGQGDKIEVLTRGVNIFDGLYESGVVNSSGILAPNDLRERTINYILVEPNTKYYTPVTTNVYQYDYNKNFVGHIPLSGGGVFTTSDNTKYIKFYVDKGLMGTLQINKGESSLPYQKPQYDKKQISTTLRSLPNGVKDTIEKRGNKYVKVQRCEEIVIDNNLEITGTGVANQILTRGQNYVLPKLKRDINSPLYCNCLKVEHRDNEALDEEHIINLGDGRFRVRALKSKLSSDSLEGSSAYWNSIKPTIVYELETPQIIELPNFNPQTYEGDTTLLINSGVIQAEADFEVTNSIGSDIEVMKDKLSDLDDNVVNEKVYYPTLLNGWVTHSADYTPCFVKNGNIVTFNLRIKSGTWSSGTILLYVPEQFRIKYGYASVFPAIDLANDKSYNAIMYKEGFLKLFSVDSEPTGGLAIGGSYYVG